MIHLEKFQRCRGLRIDLPFNWQIEVWYCPWRESVPTHVHKTLNSYTASLFGFFRLNVRDDSMFVVPLFVKNIPPGVPHSFRVLSRTGGIFVNVAHCLNQRTSAATDFVLT